MPHSQGSVSGQGWQGQKALSGELSAVKEKRELGRPMGTIYLIPLDLSFLICTMEHLAH